MGLSKETYQQMFAQARARSDWQPPDDTPAKFTNKLPKAQRQHPGDFVREGGYTVVRDNYAAYEYAMLEYEIPERRRRLALWSDASSSGTGSNGQPGGRKWGWHGTAVVGEPWPHDADAATDALIWDIRRSVLYRPTKQDINDLEHGGIADMFAGAREKVERDLAAHGRPEGWDAFAGFSDSQTAIQQITRFRADRDVDKPYAGYVLSVLRDLRFLKNHGVEVQLHWVPGHAGVPGNEEADAEAKRTVKWGEDWDKLRQEDPSKVYVEWAPDMSECRACHAPAT